MKIDALYLPSAEKEILCRELLAEFGVQRIITQKDELIHSCCLPNDKHKHGDSNPSAALNFENLVYKCQGCGQGGGLLWFIGYCRGTGNEEARRWLGAATGTEGSVMELSNLLTLFDHMYAKASIKPVPVFNERILDPWALVHPYLTEIRHVPEQNIVDMKVGYDPQRQRIIFPHFDGTTLVGWQARRLSDADPDKTKYRNSPDFPKDFTLYNYDYFAPEAVIVESPMSVLRHVHHVHAEGTFGASVTDRQRMLIAQHRRPILWFDNDKAGWSATYSVGNALMPYTDVWVVNSDWDADMGDLADSEVDRLLKESLVPFVNWRPPLKLRPYEVQELHTV